MGVIYRLKPEIKDFILEQKRLNPILSCRGITRLIENKFQIKVSKSSINSIIKQAGLSLPVGRRLKKKRRRFQAPIMPIIDMPAIEAKPKMLLETKAEQITEPVINGPAQVPVEKQVEVLAETVQEGLCTGAILLKAADYLMGGSCQITEVAKDKLNKKGNDIQAKTESLIYLSLFGLHKQGEGSDLAQLWPLLGRKLSQEDILAYLNELQSVRTVSLDMFRIISNIFQEVRSIKVTYMDGNTSYLDGQLHTVWSTPHIPFDFSLTLYRIKSYINKYLYKDEPLILCMAPGYDTPTKEFFNFILSLDNKDKKLARLELYDNKFEVLEAMPLEPTRRRFFVLGLWPWQFMEYRKVKNIGEFQPLSFEPLKRDFYVASIEIELSQPDVKQSVALRGYVLKTTLAEKPLLVILSNLPPERLRAEELVTTYINHWPNLEEGFQDFSRKIELFTYTANSQRFFSQGALNANIKPTQEITGLFDYYLKVLDLYIRWHFLPTGAEDMDFTAINERFYSLKAKLETRNNCQIVTFQPPPGYRYLKELEYACRRVNEREITNPEGKRVWLT